MFWFAIIVIGGALAFLLFQGESASLGGIDGDQIAALVSLTLIGTLVASGFLATRQKTSTLVKQALGWLAIIAVLVVGYEYRYELQDVASRVTAGAIPGSPISRSTADGATIVELRRYGNAFLTEGQVNGEPARFVVDTGATTVVLTVNTARDAGIDVGALQFSIPVSTANGVTQAARARVDSLSVGEIERDNIVVLIARQGALFENLLGMNFLDQLSGFDVRGDRLILRD